MEERIKKILDVIRDYRNDDGIHITEDTISEWGAQFGDDRDFVLDEFGHLISQVYLSKERGYNYLKAALKFVCKEYHYGSMDEMLKETEFLRLQSAGKSQDILLSMINEIVSEETGHDLSFYVNNQKHHYVYVDDILATGGTVRRDVVDWMKKESNVDDIKKGTKTFMVIVACSHSLGRSIACYSIQKQCDLQQKHIPIYCAYNIENHLKFNMEEEKLNAAIPVATYSSQRAKTYLNNLPETANKYNDYAYRLPGYPKKELFFSSPENRNRYEQILIEKGLDIICNTHRLNDNVRPLGIVGPQYRTFGLGTHFFTWRNVPNNCPLVYWWSVPGHHWKPLFQKK